MLDGAEVMRRFPALRVPAGTTALLQADGGFLLPERCIAAHAGLAEMHGAEIHRHEPLLGWEPHGDGVIVRTERGAYRADRLAISAGPWAGKLIEALAGLAAPERQVLAWFEPLRPELFALGRLPVFIVDTGTRNYYGFPVIDASGFKIGLHHHLRQAADPDALDRTVHPEDEEALRACVERYFPDGAGRTLATQVCMYTNTPDGHFILDLHPGCPQVSIAAGFSGHGFKFCSVVGEVMADLAETGATRTRHRHVSFGEIRGDGRASAGVSGVFLLSLASPCQFGQQPLGRIAFAHEGVRAGGKGVGGIIAVERQHDHFDLGQLRLDAPGGFQAIHPRHPHIHQHHIRCDASSDARACSALAAS